MSAAEKLKALDEQGRLALKNYAPTHSSAWERQKVFLDLLDAFPQIVAVVEAAEAQSHYMSAVVWKDQDEKKVVDLAAALAALDEALS